MPSRSQSSCAVHVWAGGATKRGSSGRPQVGGAAGPEEKRSAATSSMLLVDVERSSGSNCVGGHLEHPHRPLHGLPSICWRN